MIAVRLIVLCVLLSFAVSIAMLGALHQKPIFMCMGEPVCEGHR